VGRAFGVSDVSDAPEAFDRIVATIDPPMFVVTAFDGDERDGCLVGFATQCSIDPPRFLVCLSVKNRTTRIARRATALGVHVLRRGQHDLAELFGGETGDQVDKLASVRWRPGPEAVPIVDGCDWFAGRIRDRFDLGDHEGFLIDVVDAGEAAPTDDQLGFQETEDVEAGHPA
jgi:flavin reductase (DIM6/NTAB) family NADH-FMN oxidoreductase RutF